jgi:hypothetical protein
MSMSNRSVLARFYNDKPLFPVSDCFHGFVWISFLRPGLGDIPNCKFAPSDVLVRFAHLCNFENQTLGWDQDEGLPWQPAHAGPTLPYDIGFSDPAASGSAEPVGGDDTAVDPGLKEEEAVLVEDEVLPMPDRPCPSPQQDTEPTDQDHIHCD